MGAQRLAQRRARILGRPSQHAHGDPRLDSPTRWGLCIGCIGTPLAAGSERTPAGCHGNANMQRAPAQEVRPQGCGPPVLHRQAAHAPAPPPTMMGTHAKQPDSAHLEGRVASTTYRSACTSWKCTLRGIPPTQPRMQGPSRDGHACLTSAHARAPPPCSCHSRRACLTTQQAAHLEGRVASTTYRSACASA